MSEVILTFILDHSTGIPNQLFIFPNQEIDDKGHVTSDIFNQNKNTQWNYLEL